MATMMDAYKAQENRHKFFSNKKQRLAYYDSIEPKSIEMYESGMRTVDVAKALGVSEPWVKSRIIQQTERWRCSFKRS